MKKSLFKQCSENYVNWVIKLGKTKSALWGFFVLGVLAIVIQSALDYLFLGKVLAIDLMRSTLFGLISAPFVIYFFNVIVEKLEKSRIKLERSVYELGVMRTQDAYLSAKLKQNSADKTKLMATISHELRTPLNGIIGLSQILLESELSQKQREYLQTINISAVSLGHIFSDIIDLEKIDSKRIELFKQAVDFSQIINDINHFAHLMASKKQIQFRLTYPNDLPEYIWVDNARLSQVLWNLINNAVKFTPESGQISLEICKLAEDRFSFIVKDSGIGIPFDEQDKIFQMFYQVQNSERKAQGSGIGLAVSKQIAQLMAGDLTVQSQPNQGATFNFTLKAEPASPKTTAKTGHYGLRVLLVEDVEVNVVVARSMLEKFGCEIDVAMTGAEADEKFAQNSYDLVFLDIQLPDTTGSEMAQKWRKQYDESEIDYLPLLVALTANIMQTKAEYQAQGMDDVLRKPLSLEALSACLKTHFGELAETATLQENQKMPPLALDAEKFNAPMIEELLAVMGKRGVLANLQLFEGLMPNYVADLEMAHQAWKAERSENHRKTVVDLAHKMKGAFASVGLKKLQEIAQRAQTDNGEAWETHIEAWINEMRENWQDHLSTLKKMLA